MEEKIVYKDIRTKAKKPFVATIILSFLAYMGFLWFFLFTTYDYTMYKTHIFYDEHDYDCYNEIGKEVYKEYDGDPYDPELVILLEKTEGVDITNCEYDNYTNYFDYLTHSSVYDSDDIIFLIIVTSIFLLAISAFVYFIYLTKYKFSVNENNIYGKNGYKKFDISFNDITEISLKGKTIIIKTENIKLKLSPLKNCNEIYNYIKPFVPVITLKHNDIKNILD